MNVHHSVSPIVSCEAALAAAVRTARESRRVSLDPFPQPTKEKIMHRSIRFTFATVAFALGVTLAMIPATGWGRNDGPSLHAAQGGSAALVQGGAVHYSKRNASLFTATTTFPAPDPASNAFFGNAVALSADGNSAVVGAPGVTVDGHGLAGKAYVFVRKNKVWRTAPVADFSEPTPDANDEFGFTVALSPDGTTAFIGACCTVVGGHDSAGSVYVFTQSGGVWSRTPVATLSEPTPGTNDHFGNGIAATDTAALIGAPGNNGSRGAAYVFARSGGIWNGTPVAVFTEPDANPGNLFGASVALSGSGSTALVSSPMAALADGGSGKAYLFTRVNDTWGTTPAAAFPDPGMSLNHFGDSSLAVTDDAALLGAPSAANGDLNRAGEAALFLRSGGVWSSTPALTFGEPEPVAGNEFATVVALAPTGGTLLIGAPMSSLNGVDSAGTAYVYTQTDGVWSAMPEAQLSEPAPAPGDQFGAHLALSGNGDAVLVGATGVIVQGDASVGAAYAVDVSPADLLALTLSGTPGEVKIGDKISYAIAVSNNDPQTTATDVVLTDKLPASVNVADTDAAGGQCNAAAGTVTCTLDSLAPHADWQPSIAVTAMEKGNVSNSASVSASEMDPFPDNNGATVTNAVDAAPPPPPPPSGGNGGGGGGSFGWLSLLAFAAFAALRYRMRGRSLPPRAGTTFRD